MKNTHQAFLKKAGPYIQASQHPSQKPYKNTNNKLMFSDNIMEKEILDPRNRVVSHYSTVNNIPPPNYAKPFF